MKSKTSTIIIILLVICIICVNVITAYFLFFRKTEKHPAPKYFGDPDAIVLHSGDTSVTLERKSKAFNDVLEKANYCTKLVPYMTESDIVEFDDSALWIEITYKSPHLLSVTTQTEYKAIDTRRVAVILTGPLSGRMTVDGANNSRTFDKLGVTAELIDSVKALIK